MMPPVLDKDDRNKHGKDDKNAKGDRKDKY